MAIYHMSVKIISRGQGRSAIAASAYRSGSKLVSDTDGRTHDYLKKRDIVYREVLLCENAPREYLNRAVLWNAVENAEKDSNARMSREVEIALPRELSRFNQIQLLKEYVNDNFVSQGMCADIAIHDKKDGNPHAHIMLTVRPIMKDGRWDSKYEKLYICKNIHGEERELSAKELETCGNEWHKQLPYYKNGDPRNRAVYLTKHLAENADEYKEYVRVRGKNDPKTSKANRENPLLKNWNSDSALEMWRERWATQINNILEKLGLPDRVDHRSYVEQGIDKVPTQHIGVAGSQIESRGVATERGNHNREASHINSELQVAEKERAYILGRISQDKLWASIHESNNSLFERVNDNIYDDVYLKDMLSNILLRQEHVVIETLKNQDFHSADTYLINGIEIKYLEYHTQKAQADLTAIRLAAERGIIGIEQKRLQQNIGADAKVEKDIQIIEGHGTDETCATRLLDGQYNAGKYNSAGVARQLATHRAEFIAATVQVTGASNKKENPIYRQQVLQIQNCIEELKTHNIILSNLKDQLSALGLFQGRKKGKIKDSILETELKLREYQIQLRALGLYDLSQSESFLKDKINLVNREMARVQESNNDNAKAFEKMKKSKMLFIELAHSIPPDKLRDVTDHLYSYTSTKQSKKGYASISLYSAELKARQELDVYLKSSNTRGIKKTNETTKGSTFHDLE